jgi:DNA-binding CsgD family transcriptional regulator
LAVCDTLEAALEELLTAGMRLVDADAGYIRLFELTDLEPSLSKYPFVVQRGISPEYLRYFSNLKEPVDRSARDAIFNGSRVIVEDMMTHPSFGPHLPVVLAEGYRSMQATPLMNRNGSRCVGALCTCFRKVHTPPAESLERLDLYAEFAASAIERHQRMAALTGYGTILQQVTETQGLVLRQLLERVRKIEEQAPWLDPGELRLMARAIAENIRYAEDALRSVQPDSDELDSSRDPGQAYGMSPRELEAVLNVWRGMSDKQIAAAMGISRFTVAKHIGAAMRKMGVATRTQVSVLIEREGLYRLTEGGDGPAES